MHAHPDTVRSYSAALVQQVQTSAAAAGHDIRVISLYNNNNDASAVDFAPQLTAPELARHQATTTDINNIHAPRRRRLAADIQQYVQWLQWCDTLLFVYPTWWMNVPAALKGFLDRTRKYVWTTILTHGNPTMILIL